MRLRLPLWAEMRVFLVCFTFPIGFCQLKIFFLAQRCFKILCSISSKTIARYISFNNAICGSASFSKAFSPFFSLLQSI